MSQHSFNVSVIWEQGRQGRLISPELRHSIEVATPPQFPGGVPEVWSPEHLFTAAAVSCFMTTFLAVAEFSKFTYAGLRCDAEGILDKEEGRFRMTAVLLKPVLRISSEKDRERGLRILEKTKAACLISNSMMSRVTMEPTVDVVEAVEVEL
ncbi:MAG TPA: OsmC family protein [Flavobacteriales bacterium]|nr:OsmC family protein [Flavobacteriales bacterium]